MIRLNYKRFASGEFEFTTHNSSSGTYIQGKIVWSSTSNGASLNTSNVSADLYVKKNVTYATTGKDWRVSITINGNTYSVSSIESSVTVGTSYVKLLSYTVNGIAHNNDGSKTITISGRVQGPTGTSIASLYSEGSADVGLDTIPRYFTSTPYISLVSKTDTSATFNWSTSETCNWLRYHFDGSSGWHDIFNGSATSGSFTVYNGDSIYGSSSGTVSITSNSYHTVYAECRREDSSLWSNSNTIGFTSYTTPTIALSLNDKTETSLTFKATPNIALSSKVWILRDSNSSVIEYSTSTDEYHAVSGLNPGTTYTMSVYGVSSDGGLTSATVSASGTTYSYPYVISVTTSDLTVGNAQTVTLYNPLARSCTLYMKKDSTSGTVLYSQSYSSVTSATGANVTFTPDASTLRNTIQSGLNASCVYYLEYSNITPSTKSGTYVLTGNETPTFPNTSWSYSTNLGSLTGNDTSVVINNYSTVTFKVDTAPTSSYQYTGSYTYTYTWGTSSSSSTIAKGSGNTLSIKAADARTLSVVSSKTLTNGATYIPYVSPTIKASTTRKDGIDSETHLNLEGTFYAGKFGSKGIQNTLYKVVYYTKQAGDTNYSGPYPSASGIAISNFTIDTSQGTYKLTDFLIHANGSQGGFEIGTRYNVKIVLSDALGVLATCETICDVTDGKIARDVFQDENGEYHQGINGRADENYTEKINGTIDIEGKIYQYGKEFSGGGGASIPISDEEPSSPSDDDLWIDTTSDEDDYLVYGDTLPIGAVINYSGTTVPDGYKQVPNDEVYPIGAIYISAKSTSPANLFGGTWTQLKDRFIYASGRATDTGTDAGKDAQSTITGVNVSGTAITVDQMPAHNHNISDVDGNTTRLGNGSSVGIGLNYSWGTVGSNIGTTLVGDSQAHIHTVPYIGVYVWQRIA